MGTELKTTTLVEDMDSTLNYAYDSGAKACTLDDDKELINIYQATQLINKYAEKYDAPEQEYELLSKYAKPKFETWLQVLSVQGIKVSNSLIPTRGDVLKGIWGDVFGTSLEEEFTLGFVDTLNNKLEKIDLRVHAGDLAHLQKSEPLLINTESN